MEPLDDRIAKRLAEIREQEADLDREAAERDARAHDPGTQVVRREGGFLRSFLFLVGVLVLAAGLFGVAVTLGRLSADDMADAEREGQATVTSCIEHGPITNRGFGYWESCEAEITWTGGGVERLTIGVVFNSADIGSTVRVGDLGYDRSRRELARADVPPRPWLEWIGYVIAAIALLPTFVGVLLLRETLRFRRNV